MKLEEKKKEVEWYNNASVISTIIIGLLLLIIILSQSFAISNNISSIEILRNVLNHNSLYLFMLVYFIALKTKVGKKYFNYINLGLIALYCIITITSLLAVFQSFMLGNVLNLCINGMLFVYLIHTFLRDTRYWKEFKLKKSPFNEISNDGYFYTIVVLAIILVAINLIASTSVDGTILSVFGCFYYIGFARYIYLYYVYLEGKKVDLSNIGNFDKYRESIKESINNILDKTEIDEMIIDAKDKVVDTAKDVVEKVNDFIDDNDIDDKVKDVKDKVVDTTKDVADKVNNYIEENNIDEKVAEAKDKIVETGKSAVKKVSSNVKKTSTKNSTSKGTKKSATKTTTKKSTMKGDK